VPDYQLSLAIGKEGQNARLAHRLTGWKIDIRPDTEGADGEQAGGGAASGGAGAERAAAARGGARDGAVSDGDGGGRGNSGAGGVVPPDSRGATDAPAR
jgi:N utilization substance protein A